MVKVGPAFLHATRLIVMGNSGSGKSTLASRLAATYELQHLDLDTIAWEPSEPPTRAPVSVSARKLEAFVDGNDRWVAEGCYGDLVEVMLANASGLVFLDLSVDDCQQNARLRPWEPHKYPTKEAQEANLNMLLDWIADYPNRSGPLGRRAHEALFASFGGEKRRLIARQQVDFYPDTAVASST